MDMAEPARMFLAMADRIPPDEEYADEEGSSCSRPGTFFMVPFPIQKYQFRGISGHDADRSKISHGYIYISQWVKVTPPLGRGVEPHQ
jgi:hypothetical protein